MIQPAFILDSSVMTKIIEGKTDDSKKVLIKLSDLKIKNEKSIIITSATSFKNAIWNADGKSPIKNIKKLLGLVDILPDTLIDFTDNKIVTDGLIIFAKNIKALADKKMKERK